MNIEYKGARWFKCDLHLHTPASHCFLNRNITAQEWVDACINAGLHCVAVTDHNTGEWIDQIKIAANGKPLTVLPGVEITCDTSKIHILIIFDTSKTTENVNDFLIECGMPRDKFSNSEAKSSKTVKEIATIANNKGAIVIPAHIDEYNGLGYFAGKTNFEEFLNQPFIHAIQFVHKEFLTPGLKIKDNQEIQEAINQYYGNVRPAIGIDNIKNAYDSVQTAVKHNIRLMTFSDNPAPEDPKKHGLGGIGTRYTWIKMDGKPSLEGLRQAIVMPERTCHCFESETAPYQLPELWIKKISFNNTSLTNNHKPFSVNFSPQLTTIIGGRGSGKSSILRMLRGVFGKVKDLEELNDIIAEQNDFFKLTDSEGKGVLHNTASIEVIFVRNNLQYRIVWEHGKKGGPTIEGYEESTQQYQKIDDEAYIDFFDFEEYSQKQIFSIAQKPNSLRNRIDSAIPEMAGIKLFYKSERQEYRESMTKKRTLQQSIQLKGKILTEIKDLESKIDLLKKTGISAQINQLQQFENQNRALQNFLSHYERLTKDLDFAISSFEKFPAFNTNLIEEKYREEVSEYVDRLTSMVLTAKEAAKEQISSMRNTFETVSSGLKNTRLILDAAKCKDQFEATKKELEEKGISDMSDFQKITEQIENKRKDIALIAEKETELTNLLELIEEQKQTIKILRNQITQLRIQFLESKVNSDNIQIAIHPFKDSTDLESKLRIITQKRSSYDKGFETMKTSVYRSQDISGNLDAFKTEIHNLHEGNLPNNPYDGWFTRLIQELAPSQLDEIDMLYPEDEIEMRYTGRDGKLKSIAVASAGQKTTAILSFILSVGKAPLILDQPEDDLDNRLVSQLIVEKLRKIKEQRQVIVVTHNANIPVNGDAEYVVSMDSESSKLKIKAEGTVENDKVKEEICEVMEGGVEAFNTRAERYSSLNKR